MNEHDVQRPPHESMTLTASRVEDSEDERKSTMRGREAVLEPQKKDVSNTRYFVVFTCTDTGTYGCRA
jgi:hypothetical protein